MRKHRSWWIGFGAGIVVGATLLQMILFSQEQAVMVAEEEPLSVEQIQAEAERAGLLVLSRQQLEERLDEAVARAEQGSAGQNDGSALQPPSETSPVAGTGMVDESPSPSPEESGEEVPDDETYKLYVKYGMSLTEVGEELRKLGLIEDVKDFIEHARPIAKKMKVGTAVFQGKPTYDEIVEELLRKK